LSTWNGVQADIALTDHATIPSRHSAAGDGNAIRHTKADIRLNWLMLEQSRKSLTRRIRLKSSAPTI